MRALTSDVIRRDDRSEYLAERDLRRFIKREEDAERIT
jgi:hypothetical protein